MTSRATGATARLRPAPRLRARVRCSLWLASCLGIAAGVSGCAERDAPSDSPPPNVLLIVIDTLRADHLSQYGYRLATGSGLDSFVGDAFQFRQAYSPAPRTGPSTASIFTGLAPASHGVQRTGDVLPNEVETLSERLQREGWSTVGFSHNVVVSRQTGFSQGFDEFFDYRGRLRAYPDVSAMVAKAAEWLGTRAEGDGSAPFFMYLHPMNVHGPYMSRGTDLLGRPALQGFSFYGELMKKLMDRGQLDQRERVKAKYLTSMQEQYDAAVRYTGDQIGILLGWLKAAGLYENTLIVITGDHGEELFDHGGFGHAYTLYREVLEVPLFLKLPRQSGHRDIDGLVSLLDIHPTVLDLLGLDIAPGRPLHGRSLAPQLRGESGGEPDRTLYFQENADRMLGDGVLDEHFKLIRIERDYQQHTGVWRLFDLRADPLEARDLSSEKPDIVAAMALKLEAHRQLYSHQSAEGPINVRDEIDESLLRALGYAE